MATDPCKEISVSNRLDILTKAMDMYLWLAFFGVAHDDFVPQIIVVNEDLRVITLIGLGHAFVIVVPNSSFPLPNRHTCLPSPLDMIDAKMRYYLVPPAESHLRVGITARHVIRLAASLPHSRASH